MNKRIANGGILRSSWGRNAATKVAGRTQVPTQVKLGVGITKVTGGVVEPERKVRNLNNHEVNRNAQGEPVGNIPKGK